MNAIIAKLKGNKKQFEQLVNEAVEIHRSLVAASGTFGDARDDKMSVRGFLSEALKNARTTLPKIEALDKVVERLPESGNEQLFRFLGTAYKQAVATRYDQSVNLRPPVGNLHRLVGGGSTEYVGVIVQSNMLGSNPFELVALAALRATRDAPDAFGNIDDWDKHEAEQAAKLRRQEELNQRIAEEWNSAPYRVEDVDSAGRALIVLTVRDIEIALGDPATLGERICTQLCH